MAKQHSFFKHDSQGNHKIKYPIQHPTKSGKRALILSDVHMPYHNVTALEETIKAGVKAKCDVVILNGDFLDCSRISSYKKSPDMMRFKEEIALGNEFLDMIQHYFPKATIYATGGNHQTERLQNYLSNNAYELMDLDEMTFDHLLKYEERGIISYDGRLLQFGDAIVMHGDEIRGISGVTPARKALIKLPTARCVISGHLHRGESYYERTYTGDVRHAHISGHLGEASPGYMGDCANSWRLGYIIAEIDKEGRTRVDHMIKTEEGDWINVSPVQRK